MTVELNSYLQISVADDPVAKFNGLVLIPGPPTEDRPFFDTNLTQPLRKQVILVYALGQNMLEINELQIWAL